jgi:hypothetical protein
LGKGTLMHCWWEGKLVQPLWKTIWRLLKKLNIDLPYDPSIPLLGICLKECESGYYKVSQAQKAKSSMFSLICRL